MNKHFGFNQNIYRFLLLTLAVGMLEFCPTWSLEQERCPDPCSGCDIMRKGVSYGIVDENFVFAFPNDVEAPAIIGSLKHVWVKCVFGDGARTIYNRFKAKRLNNCAENIAYYFVFGGDGDSWWRADDGTAVHVDLPRERWDLINEYGPITIISLTDDPS